MLSNSEIERRKPVWTALSQFWLDTELDQQDLARIADIAAASGYSIHELRDIYLYEVAPVVCANLWSIAGEWAAFDDDWLHSAALKKANSNRGWLRWYYFFRVGHMLMTYASERHWRHIVSILSSPRAIDTASHP